jgi:hypothetical protein
MTTFGKVLVALNLVLSLAMASWAWALWSDRIDWSNTRGTAEQAEGAFKEREDRLATLWEDERPAEARWRAGRAAVRTEEARIDEGPPFFRAELAHLTDKASAQQPAREVVHAEQDDERLGVRKGQVLPDPKNKGLPTMAPAKDAAGAALALQSLKYYDDVLKQKLEERQALNTKHQEQIAEAIRLTDQLTGPRGLFQRLADERRKRTGVVDELKQVYPMLVNSQVEAELVQKRHKALQRRLDELKGTGVAARDR